ncbi:MAG: hypothetical protein JWP85_2125 [Rhodoglobus sp.]|nr:hypothetical protein [Rhodoglobus sp.]
MQPLRSSLSYYEAQQAIAVSAALTVRKMFGRMSNEFDSSWAKVAPTILETVNLARAAAVTTSLDQTAAVLAETGQAAAPFGTLNPQRFLVAAPNGQPVADVLGGAVTHAKVAVRDGASSAIALENSSKWLTGVVLTMLADTGRSVVGADIAQRKSITGYVRMLNAPSCPRCVILAGKWFRWNEGFQRHPRCDCRHIPGSEDATGDLRTDPYEYFFSQSEAEQDRVWGRVNARAVRDGGDIYRIVNLEARGLGTAKSAARYGTPSRTTLDDIYRTAGNRTNAIRMMEQEGFITGPQVRGGNVIGQREGFGALGRGGRARAASEAVLEARATGMRDPLNRYTMTEGERRLFDAKYRLDEARRTGNLPRSIGTNAADLYTRPQPITAAEMRTLEDALRNEVDKLGDAPDQVRRLAEDLGLFARNVTRKPLRDAVAGVGGSGGRIPPVNRVGGSGEFEPDENTWVHILMGDDKGGGHLSGRAMPGKTEFPASWTKATIADAIQAVQRPFIARGEAITAGVYEGIVSNVVVRVVIKEAPTGIRIDAVYPLRGDGVIRNTPTGADSVPLWSKDRRE